MCVGYAIIANLILFTSQGMPPGSECGRGTGPKVGGLLESGGEYVGGEGADLGVEVVPHGNTGGMLLAVGKKDLKDAASKLGKCLISRPEQSEGQNKRRDLLDPDDKLTCGFEPAVISPRNTVDDLGIWLSCTQRSRSQTRVT